MTAVTSNNLLNHSDIQASPPFIGVRGFFADMAEKWVARRRYWETIAELSALSDHDLNDIGIGRWQIEAIAYQSIYGQDQRIKTSA